jgi:[amino group carrier protein]-lysine/ornithine hydrolase
MMDRTAAIALVQGLVAIPSLSHQESAAAEWLTRQMQRAGYDRAFVDDAGNAIGELGPQDAGRTLVLLGHLDTVHGNIPVRIAATPKGDALYGRGSVDAKGPLATFVVAASRLGSAAAHAANLRIIVAGAVEEEAATSKGARFIAARFDGRNEPLPSACVIGEPSQWHRITLGYKGRLLLDLGARQPMAHSAGRDASVASAVVDVWNRVVADASSLNVSRAKAFDQVTPSLRRFITSNSDDMHDIVDAQIAWRLPDGIEAETLVRNLLCWLADYAQAPVEATPAAVLQGEPVEVTGARTTFRLAFRGWERAWRGDRQNALVRHFLAAIRATDRTAQPGFVLKTGTSDMNVVGPLWRCPIVAYGPGDSALDHTPDEHLLLDDYWRAIAVMEAALRSFARDA